MKKLFSIILLLACISGDSASIRRTLLMSRQVSGGGGGGGQTVNDDFNRADNADLGSNWTPITGDLQWIISGNAGLPDNLTDDCSERYSGVTWTDNQSSAVKVTVTGGSGGAGAGVCVRAASAAGTFYGVVIAANGDWELRKMVAGAMTSLATGNTTYSAGAILKLSAIGTTITTVYNGSQIDSRSDASISSGSPGVFYSSQTTTASVDDWTGQDGL